MPKTAKVSEQQPYSVLAWRGAQKVPSRFGYHDPLDALTGAIEYLKAGYQVRLTDSCVEWFEHQPVPDSAVAEALTVNGQAAAFTGPPNIPFLGPQP
jgi:hypothetical protein